MTGRPWSMATVFLNMVPTRKELACSVSWARITWFSLTIGCRVNVRLPRSATATQPRCAGPMKESPKNSPQVT